MIPRSIEIPILVVLIAVTAYFYIKERKKSYLAAKAIDDAKKAEKEETQFTLTAHITGMMCEKCAAKVKGALEALGEVSVDLENKTASVTANELPDAEAMKKAVEDLGFEVTEIE